MNKVEKTRIMRKNWYKYKIPGGGNLNRLKKNAIFVSNGNKINHELAKCLGAIMLKRFGDVKFNSAILLALNLIEDQVNSFGFAESPTDFITEAEPNGEKNRRVDLVSLYDDMRYEFENDHKIKKDNAITIYI